MDDLAWTDLYGDADGEWRGLRSTGRAPRPPLHVQAGPGWRIRVCSEGAPFLWARVADDEYGYAYVRATPTRTPPRVLPPFGLATSRSTRTKPGSPAWLRQWTTVVAAGLAHGTNRALTSGTTFVGPCRAFRGEGTGSPGPGRVGVPPATHLEGALAVVAHGFAAWDRAGDLAPLALRAPSPASDGRVKAFRKLAREGTLAPVILRWIAGLQRYLVLDGHDRLHAALLEDVTPACIAVVDLTTAGEEQVVTSRAWPLEGGVRAWDAEARAHLSPGDGDEVLLPA